MKKALALAISLALSLGLAEIFTRLIVPDPVFRHENRIEMWQPDPVVGYRNKANFRDYAWGFIPVETNQHGFRGHDFTPGKRAGTYRILGLGDSITWGAGVRDSETYLRVLERRWNALAGPSSGVLFEAVNTGVVGYSTHQELLTLEHMGLALCPDLVTVGFTANDSYPTEDPFYNVHTFHQPTKENVGRFTYSQPPHPQFYFYWFLRSEIKNAWNLFLRGRAEFPAQPRDWERDSFEARTWPVMQGHFRALKRLADAHGFALLVLLFPGYGETKTLPQTPPAMKRVADFLAAEGIDHIDLFDTLRTDPDKSFVDWTHPSALGHRLTAEAIVIHIEARPGNDASRGFTPRACSAPLLPQK